ncbi:hypothetical protein T439DRAFT_376924 [Meredithblackwellia eburnea MCA 4105]
MSIHHQQHQLAMSSPAVRPQDDYALDLLTAFPQDDYSNSANSASATTYWSLPLYEKEASLVPNTLSFNPQPFLFDTTTTLSSLPLSHQNSANNNIDTSVPYLSLFSTNSPQSLSQAPAVSAAAPTASPFGAAPSFAPAASLGGLGLGLAPFTHGDFDAFFNFGDEPQQQDDDEEECPALEEDLGDDVVGGTVIDTPTPASSSQSTNTTTTTTSSKPIRTLPQPQQQGTAPPPPPTTKKPRASRGPSSRATGFRGARTKLVPLDAPIQQRTYLVDSVTSKKRKTTAVERALNKRQHGRATSSCSAVLEEEEEVKEEEGEEGGQQQQREEQEEEEEEEDIPEDLLAAAERKRIQNTLAARKSRARKQNRLASLEEENRTLVAERDGMRRRIQELESLVRSLGVNP